jgi:glycerol-3-phosphate O-acyltransferase
MASVSMSRLITLFDKMFTYVATDQPIYKHMKTFLLDFEKILCENKADLNKYEKLTEIYLKEVLENSSNPFQFESFHPAIREPIDYLELGIAFFEPLIDKQNSKVHGTENLLAMDSAMAEGRNIILFSNHQVEADPQVISIMTEPYSKRISEELMFVAGDRVTSDPLSIPFSKGRNLFCIYSKNYFELHPEKRTAMQEHNKKTIFAIRRQLDLGGRCIYLAPSGGRDRKKEDGTLEPAPFDEKSIDLFCLLAKKAKAPTDIYTLSLKTYDLMPPPTHRSPIIGEPRRAFYKPVSLNFSKKIDPQQIQEFATTKEGREKRCEMLYNIVKQNYFDS